MSAICEDIGALASHLTDAQMVALTEAFGGTRLYLPTNVKPNHRLAQAIGLEAATALVEAIGHGTLRVPVGRDLRARHYRDAGLSLAQIARRLGITEDGVRRLLKRIGETL